MSTFCCPFHNVQMYQSIEWQYDKYVCLICMLRSLLDIHNFFHAVCTIGIKHLVRECWSDYYCGWSLHVDLTAFKSDSCCLGCVKQMFLGPTLLDCHHDFYISDTGAHSDIILRLGRNVKLPLMLRGACLKGAFETYWSLTQVSVKGDAWLSSGVSRKLQR